MSDSNDTPKRQVVYALDPVVMSDLKKAEDMYQEQRDKLEKSGSKKSTATSRDDSYLGYILKSIKDEETKQHRLSFHIDPLEAKSGYGGIYRQKIGLTPNHILRKIAGPQGDDLVNEILQARSNLMASFGRPRTSRFSVGFEFQEINKLVNEAQEQSIDDAKQRIDKMKKVLWNCGTDSIDEDWSPNLSQYLKMITRDGLTVGYFATEFIKTRDLETGKDKCVAFRAVDAATIYRIMPSNKRDQTKRKQALQLLQQIENKKFSVDKYDKDEYKWCQVINGQVVQLFADDELVVYSIYPTTNVEYNGYPLTPIDQALNAIATHINITLHNKLYFEHGRAARGMLVFKSDDLDEGVIQKIRLQFHQSINSVNNAWRMPVFGVGSQDDVRWESIDVAGRDKEFQYLSDDNARVILGAFQIAPDELPGYAHLSRGTNTQSLAESDNEYKLTAARDVGLRPLMYDIQDFFNTHIIPKFDNDLAETHQFTLAGLEENSPEREATRLGQDMALHMTYDEVLEKVEKNKIGKGLGGEYPLNQQWQQSVAPFLTVGFIMENFFGVEGASKDPRYNYIRDPFWLQYQQMMMQKVQMAMQQQMMQQQAMAQQQQAMQGGSPQQGEESSDQGQDQGNEPPPQDQPVPADASDEEKQQIQQQNLAQREKWLSNNYEKLNKSIANNHSVITKMILQRHKEVTEKNLKVWEEKSKKAISDIVDVVEGKKRDK